MLQDFWSLIAANAIAKGSRQHNLYDCSSGGQQGAHAYAF